MKYGGLKAWTTGWGLTDSQNSGSASSKLKELKYKVWNRKKCRKMEVKLDSLICAKSENKIDSMDMVRGHSQIF